MTAEKAAKAKVGRMPEGPEAHVMAADIAAFLSPLPCRLLAAEVQALTGHYAPRFVQPGLAQGRALLLLRVEARGKKVIFSFGEIGLAASAGLCPERDETAASPRLRDRPPKIGAAGREEELKPVLYLVSSLAMSGLWQTEPSAHTKMRLQFARDPAEDAEAKKSLYFNDALGWGWLNFCLDLRKKLREVGPDLLRGEVTAEVWARALRRPEPVCWAVVQQEHVSGVGNYLRADALYRAGLAPQTRGSLLSEAQLERLQVACREVMAESLRCGGHSLNHYFRLDGSSATYRPLVYAQATCPLGHEIAAFFDKAKRKCFYCPVCQH